MSWTSRQPGLAHLEPPPTTPVTPAGTPPPLPAGVVKLTGIPGAGQAPVWDGTKWAPASTIAVTGTPNAGQPLVWNGAAWTPGTPIIVGSTPGPPSTGTYAPGQLYLDSNNVLYLYNTNSAWVIAPGQPLGLVNINVAASVAVGEDAWVPFTNASSEAQLTINAPAGNIRFDVFGTAMLQTAVAAAAYAGINTAPATSPVNAVYLGVTQAAGQYLRVSFSTIINAAAGNHTYTPAVYIAGQSGTLDTGADAPQAAAVQIIATAV